MLIDDATVQAIARIGEQRRPAEACGILLPDGRVVEVPNRAADPYTSYEVRIEDLMRLEMAGELDGNDVEGRAAWCVWHTHPGGNVGPSQGDLRSRIPDVAYLVVALPEGGEPIPCRY